MSSDRHPDGEEVERMAHRFNPKNLDKLDNPERRRILPPRELLERLGVRDGDSFLDFGAGAGYFSLPAVDIVGERGMVYAADVSGEMLSILVERAGDLASRISTIALDDHRIALPDESIDFTLMAFVLHELDDVGAVLEEIARVSRRPSRLAVIDWIKREMEHGPPIADRIDMSDATRLLAAAGFPAFKSWEINPRHYAIIAVP